MDEKFGDHGGGYHLQLERVKSRVLTVFRTTQERVWIVFGDNAFCHVRVTVPRAFSRSWGVPCGSVFDFGEFDEPISSAGNDFCVVCVRHEFCRENVSRMSCGSDAAVAMGSKVPVSRTLRTANLS